MAIDAAQRAAIADTAEQALLHLKDALLGLASRYCHFHKITYTYAINRRRLVL